MSADLVVTDYNLTLVPQPPVGRVSMEVDPNQLVQLLHDPVVADNGERIASVRDQLSIVFRPPALGIIDHRGVVPARQEMVAVSATVAEMLTGWGFAHQTYGWNVQGVVNGVEPLEALRRLTAAQQIADALGDGSATWSVPQLTISVSSVIADRLTVALQVGANSEGRATLMFNVNAHNERAPDAQLLHDEAANFWSATCDIITRVVA